MNKGIHKLKNKLIALTIISAIALSNLDFVFADTANVVTLGADLTESQKQTMLNYFGVDPNQVVVLEVNNQEERAYLEGIASNSQIGNKTYSCAYVQPTKPGSGINVKTANITWVSASMVATTLSTAGMTDANVVIAANFPVSGTGALTGIMKAFEDATGKKLDEEKKEIASEELVITGELGENIQTESNDEKVSQDKATAIMNDIKLDVIKNNTKDTTQIAQTINNVTNNYNVQLSDEQVQRITSLMEKVANQNYNYNEMKGALEDVKNSVNERLEAVGEDVKQGIFDGIKQVFSNIAGFFTGIFSNNEEVSTDAGILNETNDEVLGENVTFDATDKTTIELPTQEETEGFFERIINWFKNLFGFGNNDNSNENETQQENTNTNNNQENIETPSDTDQDSINNQINNENNLEQDINNNTQDNSNLELEPIPEPTDDNMNNNNIENGDTPVENDNNLNKEDLNQINNTPSVEQDSTLDENPQSNSDNSTENPTNIPSKNTEVQ